MLTLRDDLTFGKVQGIIRTLRLDRGGHLHPEDVPEDIGRWGEAPVVVGAVLRDQDGPVRRGWIRPIVQAFLDVATRPLRKTLVRNADGKLVGLVTPMGTFTPDDSGKLVSGRKQLEVLTAGEEAAAAPDIDKALRTRSVQVPEGEAGDVEPAQIRKSADGWAINPALQFRQSGVVGGFAMACRALGIDPVRFLRGEDPSPRVPTATDTLLVLQATCTNTGEVDLEDAPAPVVERIASLAFSTFCELHVPTNAESMADQIEVNADG